MPTNTNTNDESTQEQTSAQTADSEKAADNGANGSAEQEASGDAGDLSGSRKSSIRIRRDDVREQTNFIAKKQSESGEQKTSSADIRGKSDKSKAHAPVPHSLRDKAGIGQHPIERALTPIVKFVQKNYLLSGTVVILPIAIWAGSKIVFSQIAASSLKSAEGQVHSRDFKGALKNLDQVISIDSQCAKAYALRAECYAAQGELSKALKDFDAAIALNPDELTTIEHRADAAMIAGRYSGAIADYEKYYKEEPDSFSEHPSNLMNLGRAYAATGQTAKALEQFNKCIELFPKDLDAYLARGACYEGADKWQKALDQYIAVLGMDRNNYDAMVGQASCLMNLNKPDQALALLNHVLAAKADNPQALRIRALLYSSTKHSDNAIADINKAIALKPSDHEAYLDRTAIMMGAGDTAGALSSLQKLAARKDYEPQANFYEHRAELYAKQNKTKEAIDDLNLASEKDPQHKARFLTKEAAVYAAAKQYQKAVDACSAGLESDPHNIGLIIKHGMYSSLIGNKLTAMADYNKAATLDPKCYDAYVLRSDLEVADHHVADARDDLQRALKLQPNSPSVKTKLSKLASAVKLPSSSSVKVASRASSRPSDNLSTTQLHEIEGANSATLVQHGYAALQRGENAYAIAALSRAVSMKPTDIQARQILLKAYIADGAFKAAADTWFALERMQKANPEDGLKILSGMETNDREMLARHIIRMYMNNPAALLSVAKSFASLGLNSAAKDACRIGLKRTHDMGLIFAFDQLAKSLPDSDLTPEIRQHQQEDNANQNPDTAKKDFRS